MYHYIHLFHSRVRAQGALISYTIKFHTIKLPTRYGAFVRGMLATKSLLNVSFQRVLSK